MPVKALKSLSSDYLKALAYAQAYYHSCPLSLAQFAAARYLDPEEYQLLSAHCEAQGIAIGEPA